jgi:UDP-4-amino-4,6-dideoxy-N-acetyl-beta-L-altrosamine N-acetyltransferase
MLRPMEGSDADLILAWRNDPRVRALFQASHEISLAEHLAWFESERLGRIDYMIVLKASGRPIGTLNFKNIGLEEGTAESGRLIGDLVARRQGYGHESALAWIEYGFATLGLTRIVGVTHRSNEANIGLNQALGYCLVGEDENSEFLRMELVVDRVSRGRSEVDG